jgi:hypothetical protein
MSDWYIYILMLLSAQQDGYYINYYYILSRIELADPWL